MNGVSQSNTTVTGSEVVIYGPGQPAGIAFIAFSAGLSLVSALGLFIALLIARFRRTGLQSKDALFVQSNFGAYLMSLLVADMIASTASFMNVQWVADQRITPGSFCTAQGAVKNVGNVATALWTLVISMHVFNVLVLRHTPKPHLWIAVSICVWALVGVVCIAGPATVGNRTSVPYFGPSDFWCWITAEYPGSRVGAEYFWLFFSGATSFLLYSFIFLRLRGNLNIVGWRVRFIWVPKAKAWKLQENRDAVDNHMTEVARVMLYYPVAYTIILIPIAIGRFLEDGNGTVPFGFIVFAASLFILSGLIHVILFLLMRRKLPSMTILPTFNIKRKKPATASIIVPRERTIAEPYLATSLSDESFEARDGGEREKKFFRDADDDDASFNSDATAIDSTRANPSLLSRPDAQYHSDSESTIISPHEDKEDKEQLRVPKTSTKRIPTPQLTESRLSNGSLPPDLIIPRHPPTALVVVNGTAERPNSGEAMHGIHITVTEPIANPFADATSPHPGFEDEDEEEWYQRTRKSRARTSWQPSLSAYFHEVDLSTPRADGSHQRMGSNSSIPPVPNFPVSRYAPLDVQHRV